MELVQKKRSPENVVKGAGAAGYGGNANTEGLGNFPVRYTGTQEFENLQTLADLAVFRRRQQALQGHVHARRVFDGQQMVY